MLTLSKLIYHFIASSIKIPTSSFEAINIYRWLEGVHIDTIVMDLHLVISRKIMMVMLCDAHTHTDAHCVMFLLFWRKSKYKYENG